MENHQRFSRWNKLGIKQHWYFMDDDSTTDDFFALNSSSLSIPKPELYMRAQISPISLILRIFAPNRSLISHFRNN